MKRLIIIGLGGHGRVVADAALISGYSVAGFLDDRKEQNVGIAKEYKILGGVSDAKSILQKNDFFIVAIGNNEIRKGIFENLAELAMPATIIHTSAVIPPDVEIGVGTVVLANAVINAGCKIGNNCIINSLALVDHETVIGSHSHIAQGSIIGSNCTLPEMYVTELGQRLKSRTKI